MDTRDSKGRGRFFPFIPEQHMFPGKISSGYWYWNNIYYPPTQVIYIFFLFIKTRITLQKLQYSIFNLTTRLMIGPCSAKYGISPIYSVFMV